MGGDSDDGAYPEEGAHPEGVDHPEVACVAMICPQVFIYLPAGRQRHEMRFKCL